MDLERDARFRSIIIYPVLTPKLSDQVSQAASIADVEQTLVGIIGEYCLCPSVP